MRLSFSPLSDEGPLLVLAVALVLVLLLILELVGEVERLKRICAPRLVYVSTEKAPGEPGASDQPELELDA